MAEKRSSLLFSILIILFVSLTITEYFTRRTIFEIHDVGWNFRDVVSKLSINISATLRKNDVAPYPVPVCDNILSNLTNGRWHRIVERLEITGESEQIEYWLHKEKEYDDVMRQFRKHRGISNGIFSSDGKCGYSNLQQEISEGEWYRVGSWCDKFGSNPCCNDFYNGTCVPRTHQNCNCSRCVDMTQYLHSEVSEWVTADSRCTWRNYSATESCAVIASSVFDDIYFVGDSIIRNFYQALQTILTGDPVGGHRISKDMELPEECNGPEQYFWKACRMPTSPRTFRCAKIGKNFTLRRLGFLGLKETKEFKEWLGTLIGKPGRLVVISLGIHFSYSFHAWCRFYLDAARDMISSWYKMQNRTEREIDRWPKLMVFSPQHVGLLKPPLFYDQQGPERNLAFYKSTKRYCSKNHIPYLDFMQLTNRVISYDGTHHALATNLMKAQMFLNYLASITVS